MRTFVFILLFAVLGSSAFASTLRTGSDFTGAFSFQLGHGERCQFDKGTPIGCSAILGSTQEFTAFESGQNAWLRGDELELYIGFDSTLFYNLKTRRGTAFGVGPGGGQYTYSFSGTGGSYTFLDDNIPIYGETRRDITNVQLTLAFAQVPAPATLSLGLSFMAAFFMTGWIRRRADH